MLEEVKESVQIPIRINRVGSFLLLESFRRVSRVFRFFPDPLSEDPLCYSFGFEALNFCPTADT